MDEDINISAEIEDLGEEDDFEIVTEIEGRQTHFNSLKSP